MLDCSLAILDIQKKDCLVPTALAMMEYELLLNMMANLVNPSNFNAFKLSLIQHTSLIYLAINVKEKKFYH